MARVLLTSGNAFKQTDMESMSRKELQKVIDESNMVWNK